MSGQLLDILDIAGIWEKRDNQRNVTNGWRMNSFEVSPFIYGTAWKEDSTERCVADALRAGFRAIDTANQRKHYYELGVGAALKAAYSSELVARRDLFLETKFTHIAGQDKRLPYDPNSDISTQVLQSFESSLEHLYTDYIDSYVLHGPSLRHGLAEQDWLAWNAMEAISRLGKAKYLGISNVGLDQIEELCSECSVKPSFVQNRCFASTGWDREVRQFCQKHEIHYQGFSLLTANTEVLKELQFQELVAHYDCTPAQLIFCFAKQVQILVLTGTTNSQHMQEDLESSHLQLDPEDLVLIENIAGH